MPFQISPQLASALQKFYSVWGDREAHAWSEEGNGGLQLSKEELRAFILWVRETDYDLELGPVNLMCQGYGTLNCRDKHEQSNGPCDCFTGLSVEDFDGEHANDVDVAPWWFNFRLMHNFESEESGL